MNRILRKTLKKIQDERGDFNGCFELVDELINEYGEHNLATRLYSEIDETINWKIVADLFCILIWSTSDNGHKLTIETEKWLVEAKDTRKILIAINLDVYPFLENKEMELVLSNIANKHPQLSDQCRSLIESRNKTKT